MLSSFLDKSTAHLRRVFLVLGTVSGALIVIGMILSRSLAGGATQKPLDHAALALLSVLPILLVLPILPFIAVRFLQDLYAIGSAQATYALLCRLVFGQFSGNHKLIIREGKISVGEGSLVHRLGGPATLIVNNDTAVVTERCGRLGRVMASHYPEDKEKNISLEKFEKIWEIVDLRPHRWPLTVNAMTREGIPISCELDIHFKIDDRVPDERGQLQPKEPTDTEPYAYTPEAVFRAALHHWVRTPGWQGPPADWTSRVVNGAIEGTLRSILGEYRLDWLMAPTDPDGVSPREIIQERLKSKVEAGVTRVGGRVLRLDLGEIRPQDEEISRQWIETWQAEWENRTLSSKTEGEAELLRMDVTRVQAQAEMVLTLIQALQSVVTTDEETRSYLLATRVVEALRWMSYDPQTRSFMPPEAIQTLKRLQDALSTEKLLADGPEQAA